MSSVRHCILVDFSHIADTTLTLHTPSFLWQLIRRILRSRKGQKLQLCPSSHDGPSHAWGYAWSTAASIHTLCVFTAWLHWRSLWLRVKNGLLWVSSLIHLSVTRKLGQSTSDSLETPQRTPPILQEVGVKTHSLGSHPGWEEARTFSSSRTPTQHLLKGKSKVQT